MSSKKKNRNKNKQSAPARDLATEKLTEQLNSDDEERADSDFILAEYERKAKEAEKRKAERQRRAEKEKADKEAAEAALKQKQEEYSDKAEKIEKDNKVSEIKENNNIVEKKKEEAADNDVKQFVPHTPKRSERSEIAEDLNEAFSEEPEDMSDENTVPENEPENPAGEETAEPARPNKFFLVFAVFVIIMSVIGVISTVHFCTGIISDIVNRTDLKNDLTLFLYPIVSVDPPDCDTVEELPSTIVVESAIWKIILTGDNTNYEKLYNTFMYVPAIDVEFAVRSIYGPSVKIVHQTVGNMDLTFTYIEESNSYLVPMNPHYTAYSPRIKDLTNIGELYTVTVEYIPPSALAVDGIDFEVSATKTMVYTLSKSKNTTTLHSIKNITRIGNSYEY